MKTFKGLPLIIANGQTNFEPHQMVVWGENDEPSIKKVVYINKDVTTKEYSVIYTEYNGEPKSCEYCAEIPNFCKFCKNGISECAKKGYHRFCGYYNDYLRFEPLFNDGKRADGEILTTKQDESEVELREAV